MLVYSFGHILLRCSHLHKKSYVYFDYEYDLCCFYCIESATVGRCRCCIITVEIRICNRFCVDSALSRCAVYSHWYVGKCGRSIGCVHIVICSITATTIVCVTIVCVTIVCITIVCITIFRVVYS